jgi:hypothetical protein
MPHQRMALPAARSDGMDVFLHVVGAAEQAQPPYQVHVFSTQAADWEHAHAAGGEHRQQRAVLELPNDARTLAQRLESMVQRGSQR